MEWNKNKIINFFKKNFHKEITIKESKSFFEICGNLEYLEEVDMCSHSLFEGLLKSKKFNQEIYLTFHETFLGISINIESKKEHNLTHHKYPNQIPYRRITVTCF